MGGWASPDEGVAGQATCPLDSCCRTCSVRRLVILHKCTLMPAPCSPPSVCRSIGSAERAFKYYGDIKADPSMQLDGIAHGALVAACAEAMQREISVVHERKDQYVLLERAFQVRGGEGGEKGEEGALP